MLRSYIEAIKIQPNYDDLLETIFELIIEEFKAIEKLDQNYMVTICFNALPLVIANFIHNFIADTSSSDEKMELVDRVSKELKRMTIELQNK